MAALATQIILQSKAYQGRTGNAWATHQSECLRRLAPAEVVLAHDSAEAARLAHEAALRGYRRFVAVGDHRTLQGLVSGLVTLAADHRRALKIGVLNLVKPGAWSRTLQLPAGLHEQLDLLAAGHTLPFDVGKMILRDTTGKSKVGYFLLGAGFGFGAGMRQVLEEEASWTKRVPALLNGILAEPPPRVRIELDGQVLYEGPCREGWIMSAPEYPNRGELAPQANPSDGELNIGWCANNSLLGRLASMAVTLPGMAYTGFSATKFHGLQWAQGNQLQLNGIAGEVLLELDGQPAGRAPASISTLQRALPMIVSPVAVRLREKQKLLARQFPGGVFAR